MHPTVSVIIPAFNRNHTLPRALASVVRQTFSDLEIIVIDDASTQPVEEIVGSCRDARMRIVVHRRNRGANAARNTGIRAASGTYVAFLDSDDEWDENKLKVQVKALEEAPAAVGAHYTGLTAFLEDGTEKFRTSTRLSGNLRSILLRQNEIGPLSSFMVRRSVLDHVGGFDEDLPSSQDWELYIRIAQSYEFVSTSASLVRYHLGRDSITRNVRAKALGRRMVLEKHGKAMSDAPRAFSGQIVMAGHYYCRAGSCPEGRRMFMWAIRVYPLGVKAYSFFGLSLLGSRVYEGAVRLRHKSSLCT